MQRAVGRAARRGGPGSAPRARRPGGRPRPAGLGQLRPRTRADAHTERPEWEWGRPPRGAGVSEAWPGPGSSSCSGPPPARTPWRSGLGTAGPGAPPSSLCAPGVARAPGRGAESGPPHPQLFRPLRPWSPGALLRPRPPPQPHTTALPALPVVTPNAQRAGHSRADCRPSATSAHLVGRSALPSSAPSARKKNARTLG